MINIVVNNKRENGDVPKLVEIFSTCNRSGYQTCYTRLVTSIIFVQGELKSILKCLYENQSLRRNVNEPVRTDRYNLRRITRIPGV